MEETDPIHTDIAAPSAGRLVLKIEEPGYEANRGCPKHKTVLF